MSDTIGGRRRVYNKLEREVIDQYKERYMMTTTPSQRKNIAKGEMFPKLFNYWSSLGQVISQEDQNRRSDVCKNFLYTRSFTKPLIFPGPFEVGEKRLASEKNFRCKSGISISSYGCTMVDKEGRSLTRNSILTEPR
jgi:hypothetical protein